MSEQMSDSVRIWEKWLLRGLLGGACMALLHFTAKTSDDTHEIKEQLVAFMAKTEEINRIDNMRLDRQSTKIINLEAAGSDIASRIRVLEYKEHIIIR